MPDVVHGVTLLTGPPALVHIVPGGNRGVNIIEAADTVGMARGFEPKETIN